MASFLRRDLLRRDLVATTAFLLMGGGNATARVIAGGLPWEPGASSPPQKVTGDAWLFFSASEGALVEAMVDRIIPPDPQTPGGKDAGCAVFIDRQLAGPYGSREGLYVQPPFLEGTKSQGPQSKDGPAAIYKAGLAALDHYCRSGSDGKVFAELSAQRQDEILQGLEDEKIKLDSVDAKAFFLLVALDAQQGFFADPIHGGNRDMCGWKMIGFPGARYDYREWVERHNEPYPYPPVSIAGSPAWVPKKS